MFDKNTFFITNSKFNNSETSSFFQSNESFDNYKIITIPDNSRHQDIEKLKSTITKKTRSANCVTFGDTFAVVALLAFKYPKIVRSLVIINPTTRANPSLKIRCLDWLERKLPLGLPFRLGVGIDSKPYLHRLRCPVVVTNTDCANSYVLSEIQTIEKKLPIVWRADSFSFQASSTLEKLSELTSIVKKIPMKCPQTRNSR